MHSRRPERLAAAAPGEPSERVRALSADVFDVHGVASAQGVVLQVSQAVRQVLGHSPSEVVGKSYAAFVHASDARLMARGLARMAGTSERARTFSARWRHRNGTWRLLAVTIERSTAEGEFEFSARDITEEREAEERLHRLANYDQLTGLANRNLLHAVLEAELAPGSPERLGAVLFLDLDYFKEVNDSVGHEHGDALLKAVAMRLQRCVRGQDVVARYGGDEFVIVVRRLSEPGAAAGIARTIGERLAEPFSMGSGEFTLACSIGIALFPGNSRSAETLIRQADTAMYEAKKASRNTFRFFSADMNARAALDVVVGSGLRRAFANRELEMHYQPIFSMRSGEIQSFEALLRWNDPEHGVVMPNRFLRVAEETGLIQPIGIWAVRQACRDLRSWHDAGFGHLSVAVNLSIHQFRRPALVENVREALAESGLAAEALQLEIGERIIAEQAEMGKTTLRMLRALGVGLTVEDFGMGNSNLKALKSFGFSRLKLDRAFVASLAGGGDDAAVARAVVESGKALGLAVIAEGVETKQQLECVRALGCEYAQGYGMQRPLTHEDAARLLATPATAAS